MQAILTLIDRLHLQRVHLLLRRSALYSIGDPLMFQPFERDELAVIPKKAYKLIDSRSIVVRISGKVSNKASGTQRRRTLTRQSPCSDTRVW